MYVQTCTHTRMHARTHAHTHRHTHTLTHMHTHTHTYTHTHMCTHADTHRYHIKRQELFQQDCVQPKPNNSYTLLVCAGHNTTSYSTCSYIPSSLSGAHRQKCSHLGNYIGCSTAFFVLLGQGHTGMKTLIYQLSSQNAVKAFLCVHTLESQGPPGQVGVGGALHKYCT